MHAALIGRKLCHSISPKIHNIIGPYSYSTTELESESDVMAFLGRMKSGGDILNINVTIPYKETVIPFLTEFPILLET